MSALASAILTNEVAASGEVSGLAMVLWVALPYAAIAVFIVGHLWR